MTGIAEIPTHWRDDNDVSDLSPRAFKTYILSVLWCWAHDKNEFVVSAVRSDHAELVERHRWFPTDRSLVFTVAGAPQTAATAPQITANAAPQRAAKRRTAASDADVSKLYSPEFLRFWDKYPLRKDKYDAARAFADVVAAGADVAAIVDAAEKYASECTGVEARFIKYAQGWLKARRWEAEGDVNIPRPSVNYFDHERHMHEVEGRR